jgi:cystathionine gamma-synthase
MSSFGHIPLGTAIPDSPHAVSCSLPTMAAVRGYEEKDPAVTSRLRTGYPRFVQHPFCRRLAEHLSLSHGLGRSALWLASSRRMAEALHRHLGLPGAALFEDGGIFGVTHPESAEAFLRSKLYLQNVGGFLSSRAAEDRLAAVGAGPAAAAEETFPGDASEEVLRNLRPLFPPGAGDPLVASCGMNAVNAAFHAVNRVQAPRGRTAWVQLGWLYLDTIAILRKFTASPGDYIHLAEVCDLGPLERLLAERGAGIAGVMAEVPTNPLVQTPDVDRLAELCRRHGVRLVLDPSIASVYNVDCFAQSDVLVASLTKYTGNEGDIVAGLVAVNPAGPDAAALGREAASVLEGPYPRDLARLAAQIGGTHGVVRAINESTPRVASFLSSHPGVERVAWALSPGSRANYLRIARTPGSTGGMISFSVKGSIDRFYDRLRLPKGPSFGMRTTLICPFMYLAHYDLVNSAEGRAELGRNGLDPDLLRLCVGAEPAGEIIASLAEALAGDQA